jgi:hypothetical protein
MTKIEAKPRIIEGEWDWREISMNLAKGWVPVDEKSEREHIWCFRADGLMKSQENNQTVYDVEYHFDQKKMRLKLNGSLLNADGKPKSRIDEFYRVEFISPSEMFLYDLEGVEQGETESLRMMFRKI